MSSPGVTGGAVGFSSGAVATGRGVQAAAGSRIRFGRTAGWCLGNQIHPPNTSVSPGLTRGYGAVPDRWAALFRCHGQVICKFVHWLACHLRIPSTAL